MVRRTCIKEEAHKVKIGLKLLFTPLLILHYNIKSIFIKLILYKVLHLTLNKTLHNQIPALIH